MSLQSEVVAALDGERVDRVVALLTGLSRKSSAELVQEGQVSVNGVVVAARSQRLHSGEQLSIDWEEIPKVSQALTPAPDMALDIVFEDDSVIVLNKAAGIVVHPGNGVHEVTLVEGLLARYPELVDVGEAHRPGIVHRLDRGTSGLLVVARTNQAYHELVAQLSAHSVQRRYLALVIGHPDAASGLIDAPIGRSRHDPTRWAVTASGRPARTRYRLLETFSEPEALSLLACELETGRTHQIRVHLQAIGLAVVADPTYGGGRFRLGLTRPFLHATRLVFLHPDGGHQVRFDAEAPADLQAVLHGLRPPLLSEPQKA